MVGPTRSPRERIITSAPSLSLRPNVRAVSPSDILLIPDRNCVTSSRGETLTDRTTCRVNTHIKMSGFFPGSEVSFDPHGPPVRSRGSPRGGAVRFFPDAAACGIYSPPGFPRPPPGRPTLPVVDGRSMPDYDGIGYRLSRLRPPSRTGLNPA